MFIISITHDTQLVFIAQKHILYLSGFIKLLLMSLGSECCDKYDSIYCIYKRVLHALVYFIIIFYLSFEKFSKVALGLTHVQTCTHARAHVRRILNLLTSSCGVPCISAFFFNVTLYLRPFLSALTPLTHCFSGSRFLFFIPSHPSAEYDAA